MTNDEARKISNVGSTLLWNLFFKNRKGACGISFAMPQNVNTGASFGAPRPPSMKTTFSTKRNEIKTEVRLPVLHRPAL